VTINEPPEVTFDLVLDSANAAPIVCSVDDLRLRINDHDIAELLLHVFRTEMATSGVAVRSNNTISAKIREELNLAPGQSYRAHIVLGREIIVTSAY
jgi:hypothetical protein